MVDVWILGGTGRTGRALADHLASDGIDPVLVGRDARRLQEAAGERGHRTLVASDAEAMASAIRAERPAVVVNTVGPFTRTAPRLVDACLAAGSDYVDLANDLAAVPAPGLIPNAATFANNVPSTFHVFQAPTPESTQ